MLKGQFLFVQDYRKMWSIKGCWSLLCCKKCLCLCRNSEMTKCYISCVMGNMVMNFVKIYEGKVLNYLKLFLSHLFLIRFDWNLRIQFGFRMLSWICSFGRFWTCWWLFEFFKPFFMKWWNEKTICSQDFSSGGTLGDVNSQKFDKSL